MGAPGIVAVIHRREREVVEDFRGAGATSPSSAQPLDAIGISENWPVRRLRRRAVIREASPGRFYLDEEVWQAVRSTRHRLALSLGALLLLTAFLVWIGFLKLA